MAAAASITAHRPRAPGIGLRPVAESSPELSVTFLVSSPLVARTDALGLRPLQQISFDQEVDAVAQALSEANVAGDLRVRFATTDTLRSFSLAPTTILHFICHGAPDGLVLEDGCGGAHHITAETLTKLLRPQADSMVPGAAMATAAATSTSATAASLPSLVIVSACQARAAADAFHAAGVPHVLALSADAQLRESVAAVFAAALYAALVRQQPLHEAVRGAWVAAAAHPRGDTLQCRLLPAHSETRWPCARGAVRVSRPPPAGPPVWGARAVSAHALVATVRSERLVTVTGAPGIGKTLVARAAAHYLAQRGAFADGMVLVRCFACASTEAFRAAVAAALGVRVASDDALYGVLRSRRLLLLLDGCDASEAARAFVVALVDHTTAPHVLCTARTPLYCACTVPERVLHVDKLSPEDAALLFVHRAPRPLRRSEVGAASEADPVRALAQHPLMTLLDGHPHAISLAAAMLTTEASLAAVYDALLSGTRSDQRAVAGVAAYFAAAAHHVRNDAAAHVFAAVCLMPGGALQDELVSVCGPEHDTAGAVHALLAASLLARTDSGVLQCAPFLAAAVPDLLPPSARDELGERVLRSVARAGAAFRTGAQAGRLRGREWTQHWERLAPNLWACLARATGRRSLHWTAIPPLAAAPAPSAPSSGTGSPSSRAEPSPARRELSAMLTVLQQRWPAAVTAASFLRATDAVRGATIDTVLARCQSARFARSADAECAPGDSDAEARAAGHPAVEDPAGADSSDGPTVRRPGSPSPAATAVAGATPTPPPPPLLATVAAVLLAGLLDTDRPADAVSAAALALAALPTGAGCGPVLEALATAAAWQGVLDVARVATACALAVHDQCGDGAEAAAGRSRALRLEGELCLRVSEGDRAQLALLAAVDAATRSGSVLCTVAALSSLGALLNRNDDLARAAAAYERAEQLAAAATAVGSEPDGAPAAETPSSAVAAPAPDVPTTLHPPLELAEAQLLQDYADVELRLGALQRAESHARRSLALFERAGLRLGAAYSTKLLGDVAAHVRSPLADALYGQALELFRLCGDRLGEANTWAARGECVLRTAAGAASASTASQHLERALQAYSEAHSAVGIARATALLAAARAAAGAQQGAARALAERALSQALTARDRDVEALARRVLGELLMADDAEQARSELRAALHLYTQIGDAHGQAAALNALAGLAVRTGDSEAAQRLFETAFEVEGRDR